MKIEKKLAEMGLVLPKPPAKGGVYTPAKKFGPNLVYISGCGPILDGAPIAGKLGREFTIEQGQRYAKQAMLNVLANLKACIGDLDNVKSCVKILALVASADDFYEQPQVANGASGLLVELFGEEIGTPTRSAIGVNALPGNIPVEVEGIFEVR
ncbi:MAG: RidA family protein [Clostridiaceae bacterium]|nr:RidA family protein [Clostridiaceae bacterium]